MTKKQIQQVLDALRQSHPRFGKATVDYNNAIAICEGELQSTETVPVAYGVSPRYEDQDGFFDFTDCKETAEALKLRGFTITPLYTATA